MNQPSRHGSLERAAAGRKLVQNRTGRIDVGAFVDLRAVDLLRCHVSECAGGAMLVKSRRRRLRRSHEKRQTEIENLQPAIGCHHEVRRLEIAMEHSVRMRRHQPLGNLRAGRENFFLG